MKNQMEKNMNNEMGTEVYGLGFIWGIYWSYGNPWHELKDSNANGLRVQQLGLSLKTKGLGASALWGLHRWRLN